MNLRTRLLRSEWKQRLWCSILLCLHPLFLVVAQVMPQYVQNNRRSWTEVARKVRCHTTWKHVSGKVALSGLPDFPTEDVMIFLKSASMAAHAQGRQCVSSTEARSPSEFRPSWTRTPTIDVLVNDGSLEEKIRGALDAQKQRGELHVLGLITCVGCDIVQADHAPEAGVAQGIFHGILVRHQGRHQEVVEEGLEEEVERRVKREHSSNKHKCACMDDME